MISGDAFRDWGAATLERLVRQLGREAIEGGPTRTRITRMIRGAESVVDRAGRVRWCDHGHVLAQE